MTHFHQQEDNFLTIKGFINGLAYSAALTMSRNLTAAMIGPSWSSGNIAGLA